MFHFQDMSQAESDFSLFRRKKPKKVNTVDFDELFARGHAMSEQLEKTTAPPLGAGINGHGRAGVQPGIVGVAGPQPRPHHPPENGAQPSSPTTPPTPGTPFEVYSKEEAWKKSQKGGGIGYAEKVGFYL